ncbi:MAG: 23S rRNA pseudouridine1911/1915/1917 synthase [Kiritimatiellia bacterium]|jgi:23S rRNA pseudouridine1911/1915/1917 synthase
MIVELRVEERGRIDVVLSDAVDEMSRSRAASLVKGGHVTVDGEVVLRASVKVSRGAALRCELPEPEPMVAIAQDLPLCVVYQDDDLIVIDKAAGMVMHPGPGHADGTLVNALLHHVSDLSGIGGVKRPGIVHRLDRGTSGLVVVAKNDAAHAALAAQFAAHTAGRKYVAVCYGVPIVGEGTTVSHLARHAKDRFRWTSVEPPAGKRAVTHWRRLGFRGTMSLLQCQLETGRTHQVRIHLTEMGHPIVGDPVYRRRGSKVPASIRDEVSALVARPLLHAWSLALDHPRTGERLTWLVRPPVEYMAVLNGLNLQNHLPKPLLAI